ncbi:MAG: 6-bladed beta-propeller [Bacteroides sp.]|nr:6-bladed beta-propeller [Bacteroides sp.]MCM1388855.1 6-bladed beta-propeller [Bacteroides sp.]
MNSKMIIATLAAAVSGVMPLLHGCKESKPRSNDVAVIEIPHIVKDSIDSSRVKAHCTPYSLDSMGITLGSVLDIAYADSCFYILDDQGQVIAYPINTAKEVSSMHRIGPGPEEYMFASDIAIDGDTLYLLDAGSRSIKKYDTEFNYLSSVKIDGMAMGMTAINGNILIGNLDMKTDNHELKIIDSSGIIGSYIECPEMMPEYMVAQTEFSHIGDTILMSPRTQNRIFTYADGKLSPWFEINFEDGTTSLPEPGKIITTHCFPVGGFMLLSSLIDKERVYSVVNQETGQVMSGKISTTSNGYPFFPQWDSTEGLLFGYEPPEDDGNGKILVYDLSITRF